MADARSGNNRGTGWVGFVGVRFESGEGGGVALTYEDIVQQMRGTLGSLVVPNYREFVRRFDAQEQRFSRDGDLGALSRHDVEWLSDYNYDRSANIAISDVSPPQVLRMSLIAKVALVLDYPGRDVPPVAIHPDCKAFLDAEGYEIVALDWIQQHVVTIGEETRSLYQVLFDEAWDD